MKKWLIGHFLPMWAKQTVLADNQRLMRQNRELENQLQQLKAYIRGLQTGLRKAGKLRKSTEEEV